MHIINHQNKLPPLSTTPTPLSLRPDHTLQPIASTAIWILRSRIITPHCLRITAQASLDYS